MPKRLHRMLLSFALMMIVATSSISAQILPVLNSFKGRTFEGPVDACWPVEFDGCTFVTDSVVLRHSYGAVFRNCRFESRSGTLYIAESGDGIILADCDVKATDRLMFSREYSLADRNYLTGVTVNGEECSVLDEQESIIDIDGLELAASVRGESDGPMFMLMSSDRKYLEAGATACFHVCGLEKGTFVGWQSSENGLKLTVSDDGFSCGVQAVGLIDTETAVISAYTEYGLEAACEILIRR